MKWINFLHIYQPRNQYPEILSSIVNQSYEPIFKMLQNDTKLKMTLNISGSLFEALDSNNFYSVIDSIRMLYKSRQIELTSTSKYHSFLPLINTNEIHRQIDLNNQCLRFYLGKDVVFDGFFSPEMAYSTSLIPVIKDFGFKWMILDEICMCGSEFQEFSGDYVPVITDTNIKVLLRNRRLSNLIMSALVRNPKQLLKILDNEPKNRKYIVTGMDGETFGHHRPGLVPVLGSIMANNKHPVVFVTELLNEIPDNMYKNIKPKESTWAASPQDIEKGVQFMSWDDPENEIHVLQWKLLNTVLTALYALPKDNLHFEKARHLLDIAMASDHFWWASAKPWWGLEMIEDGAFRLYEVIRSFNDVGSPIEIETRDLYHNIIATVFEWQRKGIIRKRREEEQKTRIPFVDRTLERGGEHVGIYEAFMDIMRKNEKECAKNREYEQALMWRDAQIKIETKNDIYDAVHAVDLIRQKIPFDIVEKLLDKYTAKYKKIRGRQPEQRGQ